MDTDGRQEAASHVQPEAPSSELPKSAVSGLGQKWSRLWKAFRHEVNVATNSLFYMQEGVHSVHLAERQRLVHAIDASGGTIATMDDAVQIYGDGYPAPTYPKLRALPSLKREPLLNRSAPGEAMEQALIRAWLIEIYGRWESRYRTQLKRETRYLPGAIRPRQTVLGDLGHIRNDLLHNNSIAKPRESGRCEILRWFTVGDRMHVELRHVFDFLNQMGWLTEELPVALDGQGQSSTWLIDRSGDPEQPTPALVSVRPLINPAEPDPRYRYGAGIVFENGVFGNIPMGPEHEETAAQAKERARGWMTMTVNDTGDLSVPGWGTASLASLYRNALSRERHFGPAIWGPWVQFREVGTGG